MSDPRYQHQQQKKPCSSQIAQNFYLKATQFDKLPPTICVWLNVCFKELLHTQLIYY